MVGLRGQAVAPTVGDFESLYDGYRGRIYRVILRLVQNPSDAEDLTQETFLKVQRNLPHVRRPDSVPSWLYRIATNTALDFLRRSRTRTQQDVAGYDLEHTVAAPADTSSPEASLDTAESVGCVRQYADQLPELYRVVLVLHDLESMPMAQVAEVMGSSLGATKVRLHRARKRFAGICAAECEQFYNEQGVLSCQPRSAITLISTDDSCCGPDSPGCSCS